MFVFHAVLVIGPKDFPIVLRKMGGWISSIKKYFSEIQNNMNQITNIDSEDLKQDQKNDNIKDDEEGK